MHFSAWEYRRNSFPCCTAISLSALRMNKNLITWKSSGNWVMIIQATNYSTYLAHGRVAFWGDHTRRFFGLCISLSIRELIRSTHISHTCQSLWPKTYVPKIHRQGWDFDLWTPWTINRYICSVVGMPISDHCLIMLMHLPLQIKNKPANPRLEDILRDLKHLIQELNHGQ